MYTTPEHLKPRVDDQPCVHVMRAMTLCFGHSGEERGRAVSRSLPDGGLDQVAGGVAGQIWKTHMCSEGEHVWPLSVKSSSHTSGRIFCMPWTWSLSGSCSKLPLQKLWFRRLGVKVDMLQLSGQSTHCSTSF